MTAPIARRYGLTTKVDVYCGHCASGRMSVSTSTLKAANTVHLTCPECRKVTLVAIRGDELHVIPKVQQQGGSKS